MGMKVELPVSQMLDFACQLVSVQELSIEQTATVRLLKNSFRQVNALYRAEPYSSYALPLGLSFVAHAPPETAITVL